MMAKLVGVLIMILRRNTHQHMGLLSRERARARARARAKQSSRLYHLKVMKKHLKPY
jgi:hypothetical protein